tara:strand:+ start:336 stop:923 length:588 start_codon:yes stop_codon:yes gene_type:complete
MKMKSKMGTKGGAMGGPRKFNKGDQVKKKRKGKFPDLNKDGKITQADILQGRGVIGGRSAAAKKKAAEPKKPAKKKSRMSMKDMLMPGMTKAKVPASAMEKPTGQTFKKGGMKAKGMKAGGKMKSKGYAKGGMKSKGYAKGGMKSKGYAKGGMKSKGYAVGGMKSKLATKKKKPTKQKVRGAGIARKGVRPAKMR